MVRLISRQRGRLAALKLTKLFGINDFPAAKDSGKVFIIIIYCYLININTSEIPRFFLLLRKYIFIAYSQDIDAIRRPGKTVTKVLKISSPRTDPKPTNNMFSFSTAVAWVYRLQMRLFAKLLSLNKFPRRRLTIRKKKTWQ